jgi:hypothetical protein
MLALIYGLNSPISKMKWLSTESGLINVENAIETHIPLLEAEFAGLAYCVAGKLSI